MIYYIKFGDIFALDNVKNYAHGCNCAGAMGKGIAVQFKVKFPKMYKEYKKLCNDGLFQLGDVFTYNYGNGYVFNLATQTSWKTKANIDAIRKSLNEMLVIAKANGVQKIALPKIGAGLGELDWAQVNEVLKEINNTDTEIDLIIVENYQRLERLEVARD